GLFPCLTALSPDVLGKPRPEHRHGARAEVCIKLTANMQGYSQRECVRHDVKVQSSRRHHLGGIEESMREDGPPELGSVLACKRGSHGHIKQGDARVGP